MARTAQKVPASAAMVTQTIRIPTKFRNQLIDEARRQGISLQVLILTTLQESFSQK